MTCLPFAIGDSTSIISTIESTCLVPTPQLPDCRGPHSEDDRVWKPLAASAPPLLRPRPRNEPSAATRRERIPSEAFLVSSSAASATPTAQTALVPPLLPSGWRHL